MAEWSATILQTLLCTSHNNFQTSDLIKFFFVVVADGSPFKFFCKFLFSIKRRSNSGNLSAAHNDENLGKNKDDESRSFAQNKYGGLSQPLEYAPLLIQNQ